MRNIRLFFIFLFASLILTPATSAQSVEGKWYGKLKIQNTELRVVFDIKRSDSLYIGTMDSPDQGATGIPMESVTFSNSILKIKHSSIMMEYNGVYMGDKIIGTFRQAGQTIQLNLSKRVPEGAARPQEPQEPFPYISEELFIPNKRDSIVLSGTLSLPLKGIVHNAVILISGSGPQNRNEEIMGHKPFLVLSDFLTRNGIAVLRYDDRGVGASGGKFATANTMDFAEDVRWVYKFLRDREDIGKIGIIGHSEGGIIAPIVASEYDDISFIILMAAPGMKGRDIIISQQAAIAQASGSSQEDIEAYQSLNNKIFDLIEAHKDDMTSLRKIISETLVKESNGEIPQSAINQQLASLLTPWMIFYLNYDPLDALKKVKCPVLAINGNKDLQVISKTNLDIIYMALTGEKRPNNAVVTHSNNNVTTIEYESLNHLFQTAPTGHPKEYSTIEETMNPSVLKSILEWINEIITR
ncbi:MAG: alpha/beta fold hydrolase [Bacteroidales bacterium]|nr:alpha/beta fold hydrolase [Bacteroidales bacterium]